jgi:hypothetical protein
MKRMHNATSGPWSIGIYEGNDPFHIKPAKDVTNPVLTGADATDIKASFVADPFFIKKDDMYYMFFEIFNITTDQGDISLAQSKDGKKWEYKQVVIDEKFHLSYPYIFKYKDDYYIMPESNNDLSIRLYKATNFPTKWKHIGNIMSGLRFVDSSIIRYNNKWWLFTTPKGDGVLNLYYCDTLLGDWKAHKSNPIIKFNKNITRPGGRVIKYNNKLYRFTQDTYPTYGNQVLAFEITNLSPTTYSEKQVTTNNNENNIIGQSGKGWNKAGMHTVDYIRLKDKWLAVVDAKDRN